MEISTSILNVKQENCIRTFYDLETAGTDYFHIDVMDGTFVENNTVKIMTEYCEYLNTITRLPLDVHLMVKDVQSYINSFLIFEPRNITIHYEASNNSGELLNWLQYIKENNCKAGISIKKEELKNEIVQTIKIPLKEYIEIPVEHREPEAINIDEIQIICRKYVEKQI